MEARENPLSNLAGVNPQMTEQLLGALTRDLQTLQQDLVMQLARDVARLQAEKFRLTQEIETLQTESDRHTATDPALSPQQLAQAIADRLQEQLSQRVEQMAANAQMAPTSVASDRHPEPSSLDIRPDAKPDLAPDRPDISQLRRTLQQNLNVTYQGIDRELGNYRSTLSQQIGQAQTLQQQGEVIVDTLIDRFSQQIRVSTGYGSPTSGDRSPREVAARGRQVPEQGDRLWLSSGEAPADATSPTQPPSTQSPRRVSTSAATIAKGLCLAWISAIVLAGFNLTLKTLFQESSFWGTTAWGGEISSTFGNAILILFTRMVVVVLGLPWIALRLYPKLWVDLQQLTTDRKTGNARSLPPYLIGSGVCLFFSQVLLYWAIGQIPTALAVALCFTFPLFGALARWLLLGQPLTLLGLGSMAIVGLGSLAAFAEIPSTGGDRLMLGTLAALGSGICISAYIGCSQMARQTIHPIVWSVINSLAVFILAFLGVMLGIFGRWGVKIPGDRTALFLCAGLVLGLLTLVSYLLNHWAIQTLGARISASIAYSEPIFTALFAWFILGEQLLDTQVFCIVLVVIGAIGLNWNAMRSPKPRVSVGNR
jgi:drug/metabolite transporter (DMT)-like permease